MLRKRVSKNAEVLKALVAKLLVTSFADDGGDGGDDKGAGGTGGSTINYEDLIAKARKEEKDKLYPEIKRYRKMSEDMTTQNNDNLLKIGRLEKKIEELEAQKSGVSDEEVEKLRNRITELEEEISKKEEKEGSVPNEEELRKTIRAELEAEFNVKLYRTEKLASDEVKKSVLPMFFDGITGTTNEEIDNSIEEAIKKTKEAKEQLGITDEDPTDGVDEKDDKKNSGSERPPKASSSVEGTVKKSKYSPEDIQNLDPTSEEFQRLRRDLGLK